MTPVVARLAPSPTGAQHVGNARTYLLAWLSARSQGGAIVLRLEDIDSPRIKPWAAQQALDDLRWLGLDWDAGPDVPVECQSPRIAYTGEFVQTLRRSRYSEMLQLLQQRELVYPCTCSRSDVEAAASAPHQGQEGPVYPGTCAGRSAAEAQQLPPGTFAWRFRIGSRPTSSPILSSFIDRVAGEQRCDLRRDCGDFVVAKADGSPAYQLAVVVDDHEMGITEVVRGDDLIPSTHRQLALYDALGWPPPVFCHVPLVIGPDGRRLAKRHGDTRISLLREQGVPSQRLVGYLAWTAGLQPLPEPVQPQELVSRWDWNALPRQPLVFTPADWDSLVRG